MPESYSREDRKCEQEKFVVSKITLKVMYDGAAKQIWDISHQDHAHLNELLYIWRKLLVVQVMNRAIDIEAVWQSIDIATKRQIYRHLKHGAYRVSY